MNYQEAFAEFSYNTKLEVDYENEIANMKYFANYYKNHPSVVIPKVYDELCSKNIIVEEFIDGTPLADLITQDVYFDNESAFWKQIIIAGGEALKTAMSSDHVYGDPHLGNIILLPHGKLAFVDFGLVAKKPISQEAFYLWVKAYYAILLGKNNYEDLLQTTCMCFCPDLTNALKKYFSKQDLITTLSSILNQEAHSVIDNNQKALNIVQDGHLLTLFLDYVDSVKAIGIKLDMRNYQLLKAMQAFIGSVTILSHKNKDDVYTQIMIKSMEYALDYVEKEGVIHDIVSTTSYSKSESYELFLGFLTSIADNDESLFDKIKERMYL